MSTTLPMLFLSAFGFWTQLSLGSLGILLIYEITGGGWGQLIEASLRKNLKTFYVLPVVFLLIAAGNMSRNLAENAGWKHDIPFILRGIASFAVWIVIARGYEKRKRDGLNLKPWSGGSLLVLLYTVSFASMDWFMTLDPHWNSTGFGVIFIAGALCTGFAVATIQSIWRVENAIDHERLADLGNLVLMGLMFWAYVDFMQYLIIWSGQIPRELSWFEERSSHGWQAAVVATVVLGFFVPFLALLFRSLKRNRTLMILVAVSVLFSHFIENLIWVAPLLKLSSLGSLGAGVLAVLVIGAPWIWVTHERV